LVVGAFALASCSESAPTEAEVHAACAPSNDRDTRTVESVRACMKLGGEVACYADDQTGRDEVCDAAAAGLDPGDIHLSDEAKAQAEVFKRCYGDGHQPVEDFEACAKALETEP
jgi:hypothetical protein